MTITAALSTRGHVAIVSNLASYGSATAASEIGLAAYLLRPSSPAVWQTAGLSDQVDAPVLVTLARAAASQGVVLHGHNLTDGAKILIRGFPATALSATYPDTVLLPSSEVSRGGGVTGDFADVTNGVDALTLAAVTIPVGNAYKVKFPALTVLPLAQGVTTTRPTPEAATLRARVKLPAETPATEVSFELKVFENTPAEVLLTSSSVTHRLTADEDPFEIHFLPFDPGAMDDQLNQVSAEVIAVAGETIELLELDLVFEANIPNDVYRSGWLPIGPPSRSTFGTLLREMEIFDFVNENTWRPRSFSHLLPASDTTARLEWQLRIRDGLNVHRSLAMRGLLIGMTWGDAEAGLLARGGLRFTRARPLHRAALRSGGNVVEAVGRVATEIDLNLRPDPVGALRGLAGGIDLVDAFGLVFYPENVVAEDALTFVVRTLGPSTHGNEPRSPERWRSSLRLVEVV